MVGNGNRDYFNHDCENVIIGISLNFNGNRETMSSTAGMNNKSLS